jgi:serine/threonine protein kinase
MKGSSFSVIFSALAFLHKQEVIHRDVRPQNMLMFHQVNYIFESHPFNFLKIKVRVTSGFLN